MITVEAITVEAIASSGGVNQQLLLAITVEAYHC